jgi:hypothetical protein
MTNGEHALKPLRTAALFLMIFLAVHSFTVGAPLAALIFTGGAIYFATRLYHSRPRSDTKDPS